MKLKPNTDTVRPGTRVALDGDIEGVVSANTIRQNADGGLYVSSVEVVWFDGAVRRCDDVEPWEVQPLDDPSPIGFSG